jgi:uncharacterized protein
MLSLKKFTLTTLTLTSVALLTLPQMSNAGDRQKIGESLMPAVTQTKTANNIAIRKVEFQSQGTLVVGNIYLPASRSIGTQPAVVVVGPQSSVKEQVPAVYARKLAEQGFVALTFDHRTYGESGGAPRQFENPQMKVQDIHSAVKFLRTLPEVKHDAVGLLGVCSGGGYSAKAAAMDKSINALVTVAGFYHDPQVMRQWLGENYEARLKMGKEARIKYEKTGQVDYMTNVDPKNQNVAMPGQEAYEYYGTDRGPSSGWVNRSAVMFFEPFLQFNAIDAGRDIKTPTLVIHSDTALVPDGARRFFKSIPTNQKNLHWMTTKNHIAFYDQPEVVDEAALKATAWLKQTLAKN